MSDLTEKFAALEARLETDHQETLTVMVTVAETLATIAATLDIINNNAALNTRLMLAALGSINPCAPCPTPSLVVPPLDTTVTAVNQDKCKRTQAFLHAMTEVFIVLDTMSAFAIPFNPGLILDAVQQVITALANGDTTPLPSYPEAVGIVSDGIAYIANNFVFGTTLSSQFSTLVFDLQGAIYLATDASGDRDAYNAIVDASAVPSYVKPLLKDAAYAGLWNYYFDVGTAPNLAGYDGTICQTTGWPVACVDLTSAASTISGGFGTRQATQFTSDFTTSFTDTLGNTYSTAQVAVGDFNGVKITPIVGPGARLVMINATTPTVQFINSGSDFTIAQVTDHLFIDDLGYSSAFTVEFCPPV